MLLMPMLLTMDDPAPKAPSDAQIKDLGDGYVRVTTATYVIDVPRGWEVGRETPWGQRDAKPDKSGGKLGVMTAPPGQQSWDSLYRTSMYFIMREERGDATPYQITKLENGLEAMTFSIKDKTGFEARRYVLVKSPEKGLLALSVRVPGPKEAEQWAKHFDRMVKSARFI